MWLIARARFFVLVESGQDLVEYGLLAALIAIVAMAAVQFAGTSVSSLWVNISAQMQSAT